MILAIGVTPDTRIAKEAGLELGVKDSIVVSDGWRPLSRTSMPWATR